MTQFSSSIAKDIKRRYGVAQSLGTFLTPVLNSTCQKHGFITASIILDWPKIVGESLTNACQATKIVFPFKSRTNGCLYVSTTSSMAASLAYYQDIILQKVNQYYGFSAVTKIHFLHNLQLKKTPPREAVSSLSTSFVDNQQIINIVNPVPYEPLRLALASLGAGIEAKRK